jgi:hypothetical protein
VQRGWIIALVVAGLAGGIVSLAVAESEKTPTAIVAQTTTTPEEIGQDFGDESQTDDNGAETPQSQALPFTGWHGRDAVILGLVFLGSGFWLRAAAGRPRP